ncbi:hypothetical protein B1F79_02670, partial [Coxiella-like endosymbiont of Rhipicephalus sanguineus]|uniref:hypothetical protein n=1 Tax=Coxiella-like endosymbiont of Rhipicephalus sanguineus TaxID=1955402 RepID=UPI00255ADB6F|nr:hypothetical protein [Coxiella-like endosymbiont of Rhipicephalus sanguineus]
GEYSNLVEAKPTNSKTLFLCILDEYGYYVVGGFAVVPAQAYSLGFSIGVFRTRFARFPKSF